MFSINILIRSWLQLFYICVSVCVCVCVCARAQSLSHVQLFEIPWAVAHQALLFKGFPRQEYLSGWALSPPGDLPNPGIELVSGISCMGRWILYHCATWEAL